MRSESRTALGRSPALNIPGDTIDLHVESSLPMRSRRRTIRLDVALLATAGALLGATLIPVADPSFNFVIVDRTLDVALTSLTFVAASGLTVLALLRYRETGRAAFHLQATALTLWAAFSFVTMLLILFRLDGRVGMTLGLPEQVPIWISAGVRIAVAVLFLMSAVAAIRGTHGAGAHPVRRLFTPIGVVVLLTALLYPVRDLLPPLIDAIGIEMLLSDTADVFALPGITNIAIAIVIATVLLILAAVVLYRFSWGRGGPVSDGMTAVGLLMLAAAEVQYAFWPSVYSGLVTLSDFLRLTAYTVLVAGTIFDQRADLRALRKAYAALDRMRATEAERAALEERARLAREIHDGLAQHLWFAKLKLERVMGSIPEEERPIAGEAAQALDAAIVEARQALVTMRTSLAQDMSLSDMLNRTMDEFGRGSGIRVEFAASPGLPSALPARTQVELLRIVQEALTNVRKHADATVLRGRAEADGRHLVVGISDNGRGFAVDAALAEGLGLRGMEERARIIGGDLRVTSELSGGTTVEVRVPLPGASLPGVPDITEPIPTGAGSGLAESLRPRRG
jgi:signal transduction histidine kinase